MRGIVVVGAGGHGSEVLSTIRALEHEGDFEYRGVLDDAPGGARDMGEVLGPVDARNVPAGCDVILAVGDPAVRVELVDRLGPEVSYANVISPRASLDPGAQLGSGIFMAPFSYAGPGCRIGDHVTLNIYASAGHDSTLGDQAVLSPNATLNGHASLGAGVFLGSRTLLAVGVTVGEWSKVSAGTVVTRDAPPGSLVAGMPARSRVMFRPPERSAVR